MKLPEPNEESQETPLEPDLHARSETPTATDGKSGGTQPVPESPSQGTQTSKGSSPAASKRRFWQPNSTGINPGKKLRVFMDAAKQAQPPKLPLKYHLRPDWQKTRHAFWDVATVLSMLINIFLIAALILLSREQFLLKRMVVGNLLGGLYTNIGKLDSAHIKTTLQVQTEILVEFPLQIDQPTQVTLTEDTTITGARLTLTTGIGTIISDPTKIILPKGTILPVQLNMTVPVKTTVPVSIPVSVDIPLSSTDLHEPFTNLKENVIGPYLTSLWGGAYYWEDVPACKVLRPLCAWWFK